MQSFWENRYLKEEKIWGQNPSLSCEKVLKYINHHSNILIPGIGYGRNAKFFIDKGFNVQGLEISQKALELAKKFCPEAEIKQGSVLDIKTQFQTKKFDLIYCFNVLHLFLNKDRESFINQCNSLLKPKGLLAFIVFSEQEPTLKICKNQKEVEENTFKLPNDRIFHFFTKKDLENHFNQFEIIKHSLFEDYENHGNLGEHSHKLRLIIAQKN